jgi:type III secretory pathway lipoprotein EscJ
MSHLKWATLTSSQDEIQANLIASTLQEKNIPAVTYNKKDSVYVMLGAVYVLVPEEHIADAREVLIDADIVDADAFEDVD